MLADVDERSLSMARRRRRKSGDLAGLGSLIGIVCVLAGVAWIIDVVKANLEVIGAITVVAGVIFIFVVIAKRVERSNQEKAETAEILRLVDQRAVQAALRRETLLLRYGDEIVVSAIVKGDVWHDMSKEQLLESWGRPHDVKTTTLKTKVKEEYRYDCVGNNRYRRRVYLENDVVVGWKQ